jgi:hypothetical protein
MPHLLDLTIGTEYKGNDGETYKITNNYSDKNKMYIELERVEVVGPPEELIPEE